jgi:hypothetical protein
MQEKEGINGEKSDVELDDFGTYLLEKAKREKTVEDYVRHITNFASGYNQKAVIWTI